MSTISRIPNSQTGTIKEYDETCIHVGMEIHNSPGEFEAVDKIFSEFRDLSGKLMSEVAKEYWKDPEKQRREIEELRRKARK